MPGLAKRFNLKVSVSLAVPSARRGRLWRLNWLALAMLSVAVSMFVTRWGLHVYRCQIVDRHARMNHGSLIMEPIGPQWLHRLAGSWLGRFLGRPRRTELEFRSSRNSRAEIGSVIWCLSGLDSLEKLGLAGDGVTDAEVRQLRDLRRLTHLGLSETRVTAAGLAVLSEFPRLSWLALRDAESIDDLALAEVGRVRQLAELHLDATAVTDDGLRTLSGLTNLSSLSLNGTAVSDSGLQHLSGLTLLKSLSVSSTAVTDAGVERLRVKQPDLEVTDD